ncbi:MAG: pitrilysin family protein, partial [FCB group bacterium]
KNKLNIIPPLSETIPEFRFPEYKVIKFSDKINLYAIEDNKQNLISIKFMVHRGAYHDSIEGLSYFCSQLLTRGTSKMTAQQISEAVDSIGAGLNSSCSWDVTSINITSMFDFTDKSLNILFDCVFNSVFSEEEIKRFKTKHISEIEQKLAEPDYLASLAFAKAMFSGSNMGHSLLGTKESINSIKRKDCLQWYEELLHKSKISIIAIGNILSEYVLDYLPKYIDNTFLRENKIARQPKPKPIKTNRIVIVNKEKSFQTVLRIGKKTIGRQHQHYPAVQIVNTIFGGFFLSRLNNILREKLGYTYGISSYIDTSKAASSLVIGTSVNLDSTLNSVNEIINQMNLISLKKIKKEELSIAKKYITGIFFRNMETIHQLSSLLSIIALYSFKKDYYENYLDVISKITLDNIYEIQQSYFTPELLAFAAVGNENKLNNILQEYGSIEVLKF